jgi:HEAT repeat protein
LKILFEMGPSAVPALPELTEALKDEDIIIRRTATLALAEIGPQAKEAVPALVACLKNRQGNIHVYSARALARIDPGCSLAIDTLIQDLKDERSPGHGPAAQTLGDFGPAAKKAIPVLAEKLKEKTGLRVVVASALWRIGYEAHPIVQALVETIETGDSPSGVEALNVLDEMGPKAKEAVPALVDLWSQTNDRLFRVRLAVFSVAPPPSEVLFTGLMRSLMVRRLRLPSDVASRIRSVLRRIDPTAAAKLGAMYSTPPTAQSKGGSPKDRQRRTP